MKITDPILPSEATLAEFEKFQGSWRQTYCEVGGISHPADEVGSESSCTFIDNTFVVRRADGRIVIEGTFVIDPTREPKTVYWTDTFGADAGKTFPAIYAYEGDQMIFCVGDEAQQPPSAFRTRAGTEEVLRIHQRETAAPLCKV